MPIGDSPDLEPLQMFCDEHQYNAMASLVVNTPEATIKNLFHSPKDDFQTSTLLIFFVVDFFLCVWTFGLPIPCGLLVPSLMLGMKR